MTMIAPSPPSSRQTGRLSLTGTQVGVETSVVCRHVYAVEGAWLRNAHRILRDETSLRKEIREREQNDFSDLLFSIALMLGDIRKARQAEHPKNVWGLSYQGLIHIETERNTRHERDVWFAPQAPRGVPSPPRPIQQLIPRNEPVAISTLMEEERELREWVERLQDKLRQPIERSCVDAWLLLTGPQRIVVEEETNRQEILQESLRGGQRILNAHRRMLPPAFFTDLANAKREAQRRELLTNPVTAEQILREELETEEESAKREMFSWLELMYGVRLYSTSRVEVSYRCDIEDDSDQNCAAQLALRLCEKNFRCSRVALLCLHTTPKPLLLDFFAKCGL